MSPLGPGYRCRQAGVSGVMRQLLGAGVLGWQVHACSYSISMSTSWGIAVPSWTDRVCAHGQARNVDTCRQATA